MFGYKTTAIVPIAGGDSKKAKITDITSLNSYIIGYNKSCCMHKMCRVPDDTGNATTRCFKQQWIIHHMVFRQKQIVGGWEKSDAFMLDN